MNMAGEEQSVVRDGGGIVEYCRLNGITVQAWSPFQGGFFTGVFLGNPEYAELNAVIDRLAASYDVTPDRDRDGLDHPAPRQDAGRARHHDARSACGMPRPEPRSSSLARNGTSCSVRRVICSRSPARRMARSRGVVYPETHAVPVLDPRHRADDRRA